jgi:hypothetical protein
MSAYQVNADTLSLLASVPNWGSMGDKVLGSLSYRGTEPALYSRFHLASYGEMGRCEGSSGNWVTVEGLNTAGSVLFDELALANARSVAARYSEEVTPVTGPFFSIAQDQVSIGEVFGAIACYKYQACEVEGWLDSFAYHFCQGLIDGLLRVFVSTGWEWTKPASFAPVVSIFGLARGGK